MTFNIHAMDIIFYISIIKTDLIITLWQLVIQLLGLPLHKNGDGFRHKTPYAEGDQNGNEDGADRVCNHPVKQVH